MMKDNWKEYEKQKKNLRERSVTWEVYEKEVKRLIEKLRL